MASVLFLYRRLRLFVLFSRYFKSLFCRKRGERRSEKKREERRRASFYCKGVDLRFGVTHIHSVFRNKQKRCFCQKVVSWPSYSHNCFHTNAKRTTTTLRNVSVCRELDRDFFGNSNTVQEKILELRLAKKMACVEPILLVLELYFYHIGALPLGNIFGPIFGNYAYFSLVY